MIKNHLKYSVNVGLCLILAMSFLMLTSCGNSDKEKKAASIVINEIMAANHTGLLAEDGELYDWFEIKNISNESVNLKDFSVHIEKNDSVKDEKKNKKKKDKKDGKVKRDTWQFPDVELKPGECVVVFASKNDTVVGANKEIHSSFKLPSNGGTLSLMFGGEVVSKVEFGALEDDQCYRRLENGNYEVSYEQTPGFDNNKEGFEKYNSLIEQQRKSPLKMWELHSKGHKDGKAWVEVKNVSDQAINLKAYCLSTSKKEMCQWSFPDVQLKPGEVYVVNSKKVEFKIGKTKSVALTKDEKFVDGICAVPAPMGTTVGRVDGEDGFFFFPIPTRGEENTTDHFRFIAEQPTFETAPGVQAEKKKLKIEINTHGYTVHYTTDGSQPTASSPIYNDFIEVDKTTMVRAYCEGDSTSMRSSTVTGTFIFSDYSHTIPVINVTIDPDDLYDRKRGIYVEGPGAASAHPHYGANYWKKMWKKAYIEFYDSISGGFSTSCEMSIFGGFSRVLPKKSFKIRFKNNYDQPQITCDLFGDGKPESYKKFVLRSGSQDITGVMARDEFFTSLMAPQSPDLLIQAYRPVALYINGEYFGLYYIREMIDKDFVARHLNVSNDEVSIMMAGMYCEEGSKKNYQELMSFVRSHNLAEKENYDYVCDNFDVIGLIDFKIGEIYSCNTDVGNMRFVRSEDKDGDKKWHVVFYDLDATWATIKPSSYYIRPGSTAVERNVNMLIARLLDNDEFRQLFLERLSHHMHNTFTSANVTSVFDNLINTIQPEMKYNCERWPDVLSYSRWEKHVEDFREKFNNRNKDMLNDLRKELQITDAENKKYFSDLGF